jgi:hypothetical protein
MLVSLLVILTSVVAGRGGQVSSKASTNRVGVSDRGRPDHLVETLSTVFRSPWVWVGLALYGLEAVAWLLALSGLDLNLEYPLMARYSAMRPSWFGASWTNPFLQRGGWALR